MSYEEEDTCISYEEGDICMSSESGRRRVAVAGGCCGVACDSIFFLFMCVCVCVCVCV
jgi:hypothetical protein